MDTGQDAVAIAATNALFAELDPTGPGCTLAIGRAGKVVFANAWGAADIESGTSMSIDTVVDVGSTSKQFTATAILLLAERGTIDLDAALSTYVDGLPDWSDVVTLRQMAHHVSGIPDYIDLLVGDGITFQDPAGDADVLAVLRTAELDVPVGDHFEYSNSNYFLLGQVVLQVTGEHLGDFLAHEVFAPLGLDMVMDPTVSIVGKATSYELADGEWANADSPWSQTGDGGIQTTPTQLVRWATQYWEPTIGDDAAALAHTRIEDTVDEDEDGDGDERYGWGIGAYRHTGLGTVFSHSGGWAGFATIFAVLPDERLVVAGTCTAYELDVEQHDLETELLQIWHHA